MSFGSSSFGNSGFGSNNQSNNSFGGFGSTNNNTSTGFGSSTNTPFGSNTNANTGSNLFGGGANTSTGFGSAGFGSSNNNNNNTNNNQSAGFGARPGFGTSTASTGGGLFGNTNTNNNNTFGGFGSTTNNASSTGFGSTNTGGTGGLFGSSNTTGFGAANTSSPFGASNTSTGFGSTSNQSPGFGASGTSAFGQNNQQGQNNGTGGTPFNPYIESEGQGASAVKTYFQSITCQQPYQNFSFEELRAVDYNQGRKFSNQSGQPGAFGSSTGFGGTTGFGNTPNNNNNNNNNTGFGATNNTGTNMFGNNQNTSSPFGQNQSPSAFGQNNQSTGSNLFGQNKPTGSGGLFSSTTANSATAGGGGLFGSSNTAGSTTLGGTGSAFGTSNASGGLFGQNQPKSPFGANPTSAFGNSGTTAFGQNNNTASNLFGQNQANATGFGAQQNNSSTAFGSAPFGQNNQNQTQNQSQASNPFGASGAFGQNQAQKPSLFGQTNAAPNTGSNLFGLNNNQQSTSLFGQNNQQQQTANPFGAKPATPTTNLFGQPANNTGGTGLFGSTNNQPQQGSSLFGQPQNQQQKTGLFGLSANTNTNAGASNLFGNLNQNNQQPGSSLFGSTQQQQQQAPLGSSLFGSVQQQQQPQQAQQQPQQQPMTASIMSANPYGNEAMFFNLETTPKPVGPLATPLSSSQKQRRPMPIASYKINPSASSRLVTPQKRSGYGFSYSTYGTPGSAISSASPPYSNMLAHGLARNLCKSVSASNLRNSFNSQESILNPNAFSPGGLRPNGGTGSLRKLRIDRSLRTDLFGAADSVQSSAAAKSTPLKKSVTFEPGKESNANGDASNALITTSDSPTPTAEEQGLLRSSRHSANGAGIAVSPPSLDSGEATGKELTIVPEDGSVVPVSQPAARTDGTARFPSGDNIAGDYYMIPSKEEIEKMSRAERSSINNLVVGREGVGKIEFSQVDLSNIDPNRICGDIVLLTPRSATVYQEQSEKPPRGKGLNVPSTITLGNSWPRSKGGSLPVYERKGPRFEKHIERLKRVKDTEFVEYKVDTGEWVFRVQHFSTYELDYGDDAASVADVSMTNNLVPNTPSPLRSTTNQIMAESHVSSPNFAASNPSRQGYGVNGSTRSRTRRVLPGAFDEEFISDEEDLDVLGVNEETDERFNDAESDKGEEDDTDIRSADWKEDDVFDDTPVVGAFPTTGYDGVSDEDLLTGSVRKPKSILKGSLLANPTFVTPSKSNRVLGADWADQLQKTLSPKKQDRQALRRLQGAALQNKTTVSSLGSSKFSKEKNPFATSLDVMNSLFGPDPSLVGSSKSQQIAAGGNNDQFLNANPPRNGQHAENNATFRTSITPSWAKNGIAANMSNNNRRRHSKTDTQRFSKPSTSTASSFRAKEMLSYDRNMEVALETQRRITDIKLDHDVPWAQPRAGEYPFHRLASVVPDSSEHNYSYQEYLVWNLLSCLWESEKSKVKTDVTNFWKQLVSPKQEQQLSTATTPEEQAIVYLSGLNVWNATEALLAGKDYRLAAMVGQIGGDQTMREGMAGQLNDWRESDTISEISPAIRTIYELLAGNPCVSEGKSGPGSENRTETFNISEKWGFDWQRAFGLRLFYGITAEQGVTVAVSAYAKDLADGKERVRPIPWFLEENYPTGWSDEDKDQREDILWGLLKHYTALKGGNGINLNNVDLVKIVSPFNITGNPLYGRLSFQLYHLLDSIVGIGPVGERGDLYTKDYVFELAQDSSNLCNAVFVSLFLTQSETRKTIIQELLTQHASVIGDSVESCPTFRTLVDEFKVPSTWIWAAKAKHAKNILGDHSLEMMCLLRAGQNFEAHEVLKIFVGPQAIIEEDLGALEKYVSAFHQYAAAGRVQGWDVGGDVYEAFLRLANPAGHLSVPEKEKLIRKLSSTLSNIVAQSSSLGLQERVAVTEMLGYVGQQITELQSRAGESKALSSLKLPEMPMTNDQILGEAMRLSESYYASVKVGRL